MITVLRWITRGETRRLGALTALAATLLSTAALAAPGLVAKWQPHDAYASHPTVAKVRAAGYLTVLTRERALSARTPLDRALAIVDAVGSKGAIKYGVDEALTRALRARHSLGPSGALLGKAIAVDLLDGRQALVLGWVRALSTKADKDMLRRGTTIRTAGALQLLELAAAKAADAQAPQLAFAIAKAALVKPRGKPACEAWLAVQTAARDGRKGSIALAAAEGATAAVKKLGKSCKAAQTKPFKKAISLPAPQQELAPAGPAHTGKLAQQTGDVYRKGIAFCVVAPVFKGYMDKPEVRSLIQRTRLDDVVLQRIFKADKTGDVTVAALNATLWSRRLPPDRIASVAWLVVTAEHGMYGAPKTKTDTLKVSQLKPIEAVMLGYARTLAGWGLERTELPGDPPAATALPRQLFARARTQLPADAALARVVPMLHAIDLERQASLCRPQNRADSVAFVVGKSALPEATKRILLGAMDTVKAQCTATGGGTAKR